MTVVIDLPNIDEHHYNSDRDKKREKQRQTDISEQAKSRSKIKVIYIEILNLLFLCLCCFVILMCCIICYLATPLQDNCGLHVTQHGIKKINQKNNYLSNDLN